MTHDAARRADSEASAKRRLALVLRHGRSSTAFRALGPELEVWYHHERPSAPADGGASALVAFAAVRGAAVSAGEPLADEEALVPVAEAFMAAQRAAGRRP